MPAKNSRSSMTSYKSNKENGSNKLSYKTINEVKGSIPNRSGNAYKRSADLKALRSRPQYPGAPGW